MKGYSWLETRAAERRWRQFNDAKRAEGCPCGRPGTVAVASPGPVVGRVRPTFWRCDDHAQAPLTVPWSDGQPEWHQPRSGCTWSSASIATDIITACGCGTHVGELQRA